MTSNFNWDRLNFYQILDKEFAPLGRFMFVFIEFFVFLVSLGHFRLKLIQLRTKDEDDDILSFL